MININVDPHEVAVQYVNGRFVRVLEPGRHRRPLRGRFTLHRVDLRERLLAMPLQELLTSDGLGVRLSVVARWRVADARAFVEVTADAPAALYSLIQLALRDALAARTAEQILADRGAISSGLAEQVAGDAAAVGIAAIAVSVRDLAFPAEVGRVLAELALASRQSAVALEKARSETAALRALANAAKLLDEHPAMALLRTVEKVPYGSKVVLELPKAGS